MHRTRWLVVDQNANTVNVPYFEQGYNLIEPFLGPFTNVQGSVGGSADK